jgi:hypothetical protein
MVDLSNRSFVRLVPVSPFRALYTALHSPVVVAVSPASQSRL